MDIKIEGNPGTGNTFQEINITGPIQNYNPAATTVVNNYGTQPEAETPARKKAESKTVKAMLERDQIDTTPIRTEILNYVSCLRPHVQKDKQARYMQLWDKILDLPEVEGQVYDPGKQQGTNFNRNLVANIIHFLDYFDFYAEVYNAAAFTFALEADKEHSVRAALGTDPSERVKIAVENLVKEQA